MIDLELLEVNVITYLALQLDISSNEKVKRSKNVLNFILDKYNKYQEVIEIQDAYNVLYGDEK